MCLVSRFFASWFCLARRQWKACSLSLCLSWNAWNLVRWVWILIVIVIIYHVFSCMFYPLSNSFLFFIHYIQETKCGENVVIIVCLNEIYLEYVQSLNDRVRCLAWSKVCIHENHMWSWNANLRKLVSWETKKIFLGQESSLYFWGTTLINRAWE